MLSLEQIAEIVRNTARTLNLPTEVVGVTPVGHDGGFAEILLIVAECTAEPCRLVVEVERAATADVLGRKVTDTLHQHGINHPNNLQV
jgi:hypothetical protein